MTDSLTPQLIRRGIDLNQSHFGNEIDVDDDAVDAVIELINQLHHQLKGKTGTDRIALITSIIPGVLGDKCLAFFKVDYDELSMCEYLCNYILHYASDEAIIKKRKSVSVYHVLLVIDSYPDLKGMFHNLQTLIGKPTLPLPVLYQHNLHMDYYKQMHIMQVFKDENPDIILCVANVVAYINAVIDNHTLQYLKKNVKEIINRDTLNMYIVDIIHKQMILNRNGAGPLTFKNFMYSVTENTIWDLSYFLNLPLPTE